MNEPLSIFKLNIFISSSPSPPLLPPPKKNNNKKQKEKEKKKIYSFLHATLRIF